MKTKDLTAIASVALVTATLTVAVFWSGLLNAGGDGLNAKIATPKLTVQGVDIMLAAADGRTFKWGDEPGFELKAVNTTTAAVTVPVRVMMTATSPGGPMSRVPSMQRSLWQQQLSVSLNPNETKVIPVSTQTKLPANNTIAVLLQQVEPAAESPAPARPGNVLMISQPGVVALNFATVLLPAQKLTVQ